MAVIVTAFTLVLPLSDHLHAIMHFVYGDIRIWINTLQAMLTTQMSCFVTSCPFNRCTYVELVIRAELSHRVVFSGC